MEHSFEICEKFDPEEVIEPGDVIEVTPNGKYQRTQKRFSGSVIGVAISEEVVKEYSSLDETELKKINLQINDILDVDRDLGDDHKPSVEAKPGFIYVSTCGRVELNVIGLCRVGDLLVSSQIPGYAMAYDRTKAVSGTIIGKVVNLTEDKHIVIVQLMLS